MYDKITETLNLALSNGYKAYEVEGHDGFAFLITPDDNVLTVNRGDFGGLMITFDYIPSRETGAGCACQDEDIYKTLTIDDLKQLEAEGLSFAKKLNAKFYKNSEEWHEKCYWNGRGLKEYVGVIERETAEEPEIQ